MAEVRTAYVTSRITLCFIDYMVSWLRVLAGGTHGGWPMFGWMRGTARGAQGHCQDLGRVYSLADDCLSAQNRWTAHPIIQMTWTRVFVEVAGELYALDRAKLGRDGHVFAAGICFYANAAKRQLESIWDEAKTDAPLHATPPDSDGLAARARIRRLSKRRLRADRSVSDNTEQELPGGG